MDLPCFFRRLLVTPDIHFSDSVFKDKALYGLSLMSLTSELTMPFN